MAVGVAVAEKGHNYSGLVYEDELLTEHESAGLRTTGDVPAGFMTEVATVTVTIAEVEETGLKAQVFLTDQTLPALGTLAFEVHHTNATNATLYAYTVRAQSIIISVTEVVAPEQATLTALYLDENYYKRGHALSAPEGFAFAGANLTVPGEHGSRFTIGMDDTLQPANASLAAQRPEAGRYAITVEMTHRDMAGTLTLSVPVWIRIQTSLLANNVLAERERVQDAVAGHFGSPGDAGHMLTLSSGYTLAALKMSAGVTVDVKPEGYEVRLLSALEDSTVAAAFEGNVRCAESLDCNPSQLSMTVTVYFGPVSAPAQAALTASHLDANYDGLGHALSAPEGFAFADATLTVLGEHGSRFAIGTDDKLQPANASVAAQRPEVGKYAITVGMTHGGFLGTLALPVSVRIQTSLLANNVLAERERVQDAVAGRFGSPGDAGHMLTLSSGHTLAALKMSAGVDGGCEAGGLRGSAVERAEGFDGGGGV